MATPSAHTADAPLQRRRSFALAPHGTSLLDGRTARQLSVFRTFHRYEREQKPWHQDAGPTAFAPFKKDTKYFGKPEQNWMVNFRVADLKAMVAQLRAAGITVEEPQSYPNGDFARLEDPEGNPIELWQPKEPK